MTLAALRNGGARSGARHRAEPGCDAFCARGQGPKPWRSPNPEGLAKVCNANAPEAMHPNSAMLPVQTLLARLAVQQPATKKIAKASSINRVAA